MSWKLLGVMFVLLGFAGPAGAWGVRQGEPEPTGAGVSTLALIQAAADRGEIDPDTAVLLRVYAVMDDTRLPAAYRGDVPLRDGTGVLRQARARYPELAPEIQEKLRPYLFPRGEP